MPRALTEERVLKQFHSDQWDSSLGPKPIKIFAKFRPKWLILGFILLVITSNLGAFGTVIIVLGVVSIVLKMIVDAGKPSSRKIFMNDVVADINEAIVQLTGDANAHLSVKRFQALAEPGQYLPLSVNGVPGLDLRVVSEGPPDRVAAIARIDESVRTTRVIITATAPDYATASFDRLLQAAVDANRRD